MYLVHSKLLKGLELKKWPFGDSKFKKKLWFGDHHMVQQ
jgi:hypothetical protein